MSSSGSAEGKLRRSGPEEDGWKDTVVALPGEVTRLRMKFGKDGRFVWHCHLLEHDNEMMRPFRVGPPQAGEPVWGRLCVVQGDCAKCLGYGRANPF